MKYETVMKKITDGLTGDPQKDIPYLMEQTKKYKDHEMGTEILRACGRLMSQCVPEDTKEEVTKIIQEKIDFFNDTLHEARVAQREQKFDEALTAIEKAVHEIEELGFYKDDRVSEYRCFNEFFEEVLYREYEKPTKTLRYPDFPTDQIYLQYGSSLIDAGRPKDAEAALTTAMRWNPASVDIAIERAEACKLQGKLEDFFKITLDSFKYAFRPKQVARCFRNLGFYFAEKTMWRESAACLKLSIQFDRESEMAFSEILYIETTAGKDVNLLLSPEEIQEIAKKYNFPFGAHKDVLGLSYTYGEYFADKGDADLAEYCWQITYGLTGDENIKKLIDNLPKH